MEAGIILNWNDINQKEFYTRALQDRPLFYDEKNDSWIIYSYSCCKVALLSDKAHIPPPDINNKLLSAKAVLLLQKLVRLTNNEQHTDSRKAAEVIFKSIQSVSVTDLLNSLISKNKDGTFDWVSAVCKKLPVLVIAKGLNLEEDECAYVLDHIEQLAKIMSPQKTVEDVNTINGIAEVLFTLAEKHILKAPHINIIPDHRKGKWTDLFVCNLIGLLIQTYDAGRGLLCNALIQLSNHNEQLDLRQQDDNFFRQSVIETLRFDPPIHNTRRIAVEDISISGRIIKKGENILIVLAAANLDPQTFTSPLSYNISRANNNEHLTFGAGGHMCLAKHLTVDITAKACRALYQCSKHISIPKQSPAYEPQLNARLIKELFITIV